MVDITDRKRVEDAARNISARVIRAQEDERRRISRDLHDSLGQYLTGLKCSLGAIMRDPDCNNQLRQKLKDCGETLRICMDETRSISQMLHPPVLDLLGLAPTLRSYAEAFSRRTGIRVEVQVSGYGRASGRHARNSALPHRSGMSYQRATAFQIEFRDAAARIRSARCCSRNCGSRRGRKVRSCSTVSRRAKTAAASACCACASAFMN